MKKLALVSLLLVSSLTQAEYFYYWADDYNAYVDAKGNVFVSTYLKSSDISSYDFIVGDKVIAKNITVQANEITDFPINISSKYTKGNELVLCALKHASNVNFNQQVCLNIKLVK